MISQNKKQEIVEALSREKQLLGSMNSVAKKLAISPATISANLLKPENWGDVSDSMWVGIAQKLGVSMRNRDWVVVPTTNYKIMHRTLSLSQNQGLFMAVSEKAGSGKTMALVDYVGKATDHSVFYLQCEEWSRISFLNALCSCLGLSGGRESRHEVMTDAIVKFFKMRCKSSAPLLILDEADKLKPAALRFLILLYNRLKGDIGVVICGTDNLEKEIKSGVKRSEKGYDEIHSRFGRSFVHLVGSSLEDVALLCSANGVTDPATINRIFSECGYQLKPAGKKYIDMIEDLREVEWKVRAEQIKLSRAS